MMSTTVPIHSGFMAGSATRAADVTRACTRLAWLATSSTARYLVWLAGDVVLANRPATRRDWRAWCMRRWARAAVRAAGVQVHLRGPVPEAPFLLVANHLSYIDIIVLAALVDGRFVARHDLGNWPLIGRLVRAGGTILVQRDRRADTVTASTSMRQAIEEGSGVILFPEGTSTSGQRVLPFRSPLFEPAIELRQAVHTAALHYSTPVGSLPAADVVCWWGDASFMPHLWQLLQLPRIDAYVAFGECAINGGDRKALSASAHDAVASLHESLKSEGA
ncbi:MAG: 1-acyl-sn-glycerol-3-phosphate acyltransferase [Blastocatellia bacterium]|jgi:1-acyl-sn-glycerol-3-phosphate acyltransferase|nr:1-acyl-sn-glycerol-3-phosphate acyltransferase [Blastocatellia bacterium]